LQFKVSIPGNTDIVRISYETVVVNAGINILNHLSDLILKQYSETVKVHKKEYDTKISMKKNNLQYSQDELINVKRTINNYEKRTAELAAEMQSLESSNALLRERKDALIDNRNANDVLVVFLYDNTIQRSLELKNRYKDELFNYMSERDRAKLRLKKIQEQIDTLSKEMEDLKEAKNMIAGITVLQPPSPSPYPIAPKKKLNVMLAAVVGLFAMLFLAFFLEYLSKYKHKENQ
jgi:uncharacterized protein involved in exopolysaccharide biosynthesis